MFSNKKFCDVRFVIGALVVNGFQCRWETIKTYESVHGTIVVETRDGAQKLGTFRDGASFVVKVEIVQDIIDDSLVVDS